MLSLREIRLRNLMSTSGAEKAPNGAGLNPVHALDHSINNHETVNLTISTSLLHSLSQLQYPRCERKKIIWNP